MLDGLDSVNWSAVKHAYGEATDVPELLRALLSPEESVRGAAYSELFSTIWHQGTIYAASALAIPFLYELLVDPETPQKEGVALLIATIADGTGYFLVHARKEADQERWRSLLAKQGKTLEIELEREAVEVKAVREAVSRDLRQLLPYLRDPHVQVRMSIAAALGHFPEHASWLRPAIEEAMSTEEEREVWALLAQSYNALAGA